MIVGDTINCLCPNGYQFDLTLRVCVGKSTVNMDVVTADEGVPVCPFAGWRE